MNIQTTSPVTLAGTDSNSSLTIDPAGLTTASVFTLQANASLAVSTPTTIKEKMSGGSSLSKSGTSTLTLGAGNSYTGTTTVSAGTVLVANSSGSGTGTGVVTVGSGGTLGGTGTITGAVTVKSGGCLAPGAGAVGTGMLTTGNVTLAGGASSPPCSTGRRPGSGYGQLSVTSGKTLTLGGATLSISCGPDFNPAAGNAFTLISNAGNAVSGTFSGLANGAAFTLSTAPDGKSRAFQMSYTSGSAAKNVVVNQVPGTTTTTLTTSSANPSPASQPVSLTATVSGSVAYGMPPAGAAVTFLDGDVSIGTGLIAAAGSSGVATLSVALLTASTVHTLTAVYGGDANLLASTSNAIMQTVHQATPTITWSNPADITYGTALDDTQLNATVSVAGTLTYSQAAGTVLTAGAGQALSATFTPTDTADYSSATATISINVNQATPTVAWNNPADISYGTALSGTQLNATASVAGTLAYSQGAGTVLNAGAGQVLSATFTPTDTTDYSSATATVSINVNQATSTISWSNPADITYGTALDGTQLNATASVDGTLTTARLLGPCSMPVPVRH